MARRAHITGDVAINVTFSRMGTVQDAAALDGSTLLRADATDFVAHWQINPADEPRQCRVVVAYVLDTSNSCDSPVTVTGSREGELRYTVHLTGPATCVTTYDPVHRRNWFERMFRRRW